VAIIGEGLVAIRPETSGFATSLESKMQGALGGIPAPVAAITAGVVALGVTVFAVGEKFQGAFNQIKVGTGESGSALESLDKSFKTVLAGTAGSFDQVAAAISGVHQRTNLVGPALEDLAKKEVTLARITKTDVGANVESTTALFNKFGIAAKDQSGALDVLFKASQNGGKGLDTLTGELQKGGVALKDLGFTLPQSAALISNLEKAGVNVSPVLTGLTKTLGTLAKAGKDPQEAFQGIIKQIQGAGTESEALGLTIQTFGAKAGPELVAAIRSGKFEFADLAKQLADGKGGINETGSAVSTLGGKFARLKNEILVALEPAGSALVRLANEGMGKVVAFVPRLIDAVRGVGDALIAGFENPAAKVGKTVGALEAVFLHIGAAFAFLVAGFKDPAAMQGPKNFMDVLFDLGAIARRLFEFVQDHARPILIGLGVALLAITSPVTLVIGSLVLLYTHFQVVRDVVAAVVAFVVEVFPKIVEAVTHAVNAVRDIITVVLEVIRVYWAVWGDAILAVVAAAFETIRNTVETVIRIVAGVINLVLDLINGDWGKAWDDIKGILSAAWDFIRNAVEIGINLLWGLFKALPGKLLGALAGLAEDLFGVGERALARLYDAATSGASDLIGFVEGIPGRILGALGDLGDLLWDAGAAIMRGFLNGLKAVWNEVTGFVSGIGGWIANHKGPLETDRVLLIPHGKAIMDSLSAGLEARRADLLRRVGEITNIVGGIGADAPTGGGGGGGARSAAALGGGVGARPAAAGATLNATIVGSDPGTVVAMAMAELNWAAGF
jgi:phage-related protein